MGASHDILHELVTTDHFKGSKVVRNPQRLLFDLFVQMKVIIDASEVA